MLEVIPRSKLAEEFRGPDGEISERVIAGFLRDALRRWGLSPRRAVIRHASEQLRAADVEAEDAVGRVLRRLMAIGECAEVFVGAEPYIAPADPRWLSIGGGMAALLGLSDPPEGIRRVATRHHADIVVRVEVGSDDDTTLLEVAGAREISLAEWLDPCDFVRHEARRTAGPVRSLALGRFWEKLEKKLVREGLPVGDGAEIRALSGPPGQFFGKHDTTSVEGRWTAEPPPGVWCAIRRGYGERHWLPTILSVEHSGDRRALDLYDMDEWRWAVLARGKSLGPEEQTWREGGQQVLTFPPPAQLRAALDLLGPPVGPWRWEVADDAPDVWSLLA